MRGRNTPAHSEARTPDHSRHPAIGFVASFLAVSCGAQPSATIVDGGFRSTPASVYDTRTLQGFTLRVAPGVVSSMGGQRALGLLDEKLGTIAAALPPGALAKVREVPLWLSVDDSVCPAACYHPSSAWLTENGFEPAKSGGVEITNLSNFVKWSEQQPSMVLHELSHGYHHQVLGFGDPEILSAYEALVASKAFESVAYVSGGARRHYALTSAVEMFAELSESHFGRNDFAPFDRQELTAQQPALEALMVRKWGP
jgi:hypothetical protein